MTLLGIDPNDPIPSDLREFIFAAGTGGGGVGEKVVLLFGTKTSDGSETTNTIGDPIADLDDCIARAGARSEIRWEYEKYREIDKNAIVYFIAVPEAGGATAASRDYVFATNAAKAFQWKIEWGGEVVFVPIAENATPTTQGDLIEAAINEAHEGGWPFTGSNTTGTVTVTTAQADARAGLALAQLRITAVGTGVGTTCTPGSVTAGTGTSDFTTALAEMAKSTYNFQVSPCHATAGVTATDNQIGEHITAVRDQWLPVNGRQPHVFFGLVGTPTQAVTVAQSSAANSVFAHFVHSENSPWLPGMIAAHHAAIARVQSVAYPGFNINGYTLTDSTPYAMPAPYSKTDWPTESEIRAMLNGGVSPVAFTTRGAAYLVRFITSRSLNAAGSVDHRAREGHIPYADEFYWETLYDLWQTIKQPNVSDDLPKGQIPRPLTSYPSQLRDLAVSLIVDLAGPNPRGIYPGPILDPASVDLMINSVVARKAGTGKLSLSLELRPVEHLIGSETKMYDTSPRY